MPPLTNKRTGQPRTSTPYEYGVRAENNCRTALRSVGYHVIRAAASQGIFDLVAWHTEGRDVLGVQIKRGQKPSPCDYKTAVELPVPVGTIKLVVWYPEGLQNARILYCANSEGVCPLPDWCWQLGWQAGPLPKQSSFRGL